MYVHVELSSPRFWITEKKLRLIFFISIFIKLNKLSCFNNENNLRISIQMKIRQNNIEPVSNIINKIPKSRWKRDLAIAVTITAFVFIQWGKKLLKGYFNNLSLFSIELSLLFLRWIQN